MAQLAFYISTRVPSGHSDPDMKGFRERFLAAIPLAYAEAEKAPGFVAHANQIAWDNAKSEFDQDYGPWGTFAVPRYFDGARGLGVRELSQSLSIWTCLEALYAYAYDGLHGEVLKVSRARFHIEFYAVAWWVAEGSRPTWTEAVDRLHHVYDHGPSPRGFWVSHALDEHGNPAKLNPRKLAAYRKHGAFDEIEI
jgi:Domain of unknown function (DUF3291)